MNSSIWSIVALLAVVGLAAACGGQAPSPVLTAPAFTTATPLAVKVTPGPTATRTRGPLIRENAAPTPPCPDGVVTVSVHDWSSMDQQQSWDQVIREFEAANPCIKVNTVRLPDDREARLLEITNNTAPDLVGVDSSDLARTLTLGGVRDLTPFIYDDAEFKPDTLFDPAAWQAGIVSGMPVAVVKDYSTSAFYINVNLFEQLRVQIPQDANWSYDDFLDTARLLTLDVNGNNAASPNFDPNHVAIWGASLPWWDGPTGWWRGFQNLLYAWGAHTISPDGWTTEGYLNSPQAIQAWAWYSDLIHVYHVAPDISLLANLRKTNEELFLENRLAIASSFWGPWYLSVFENQPQLKWQVVPLPGGPSGRKSAMMWMGWGINLRSDHPWQAWTLLKWLTTDPGQSVFAGKALTADLAVAQRLQQNTDPFWGVFSRETANLDVSDDASSPYYTTCVDVPGSALLGRMMAEDGGQFDIQNELDQFASLADQCLWQYNPGKKTAAPLPLTQTPPIENPPENLMPTAGP